MEKLAIEAYPNTPKHVQDSYLNEYFIKGLNNPSLKHEMVLSKGNSTEDVLSNAIILQAKLAKLNETNSALDTYLQHIDNSQAHQNTQYQTPNQAQTTYNQPSFTQPNPQRMHQTSNRFFNPNITQNQGQQTRFNNRGYTQQQQSTNNSQTYNTQNQQTFQAPAGQTDTNAPNVCYSCNRVGHYARNCPNPTNNRTPRIYTNRQLAPSFSSQQINQQHQTQRASQNQSQQNTYNNQPQTLTTQSNQ